MSVRVEQACWPAKKMLAIPEWEGQRDTPKRAEKYRARPDYDPSNSTIKTGWATVVVGKVESRVNGNTRAFMVNHHLEDEFTANFPTEVFGDKYFCTTKEEAQDVYNSIDNTSSSKGAADKLTSALKACGAGVKSKMYRSGRGTSGLAIAWRALLGQASNSVWWNTEAMVMEFLPEIKLVDQLMETNGVATANRIVGCPGFQMGMLISLYRARHSPPPRRGSQGTVDEVYAFWDDVIKNEGIVALGSGLGTGSPIIKMWNMVKSSLDAVKGQQSRITWFEVAGRVLHIFEHRDHKEVGKLPKDEKKLIEIVKEFFPCKNVVEQEAMAA